MIKQDTLGEIKEIVEEFFKRMTLEVGVDILSRQESPLEKIEAGERTPALSINVDTQEPQLLIGERGQTLAEIQHLLRAILRKKIKEPFFVDFDVADYKKKKVEYLREMARSAADEVALDKKEKWLPPMLPYERRIIHLELSERQDVVTESLGEEPERKVVIRPKI